MSLRRRGVGFRCAAWEINLELHPVDMKRLFTDHYKSVVIPLPNEIVGTGKVRTLEKPLTGQLRWVAVSPESAGARVDLLRVAAASPELLAAHLVAFGAQAVQALGSKFETLGLVFDPSESDSAVRHFGLYAVLA